jgi:hypothetical protein
MLSNDIIIGITLEPLPGEKTHPIIKEILKMPVETRFLMLNSLTSKELNSIKKSRLKFWRDIIKNRKSLIQK